MLMEAGYEMAFYMFGWRNKQIQKLTEFRQKSIAIIT